MTAIAAAIALASAPLFAQDIVAPDLTSPAPVVDATPAPVAADPLEPAQAADAPAAADPVAPEAVAKPAAPKAKTAKSTAARPRPAPARAAIAAPAVAAAPAAASIAPVAEAPAVEALPVQPEAAPAAAVAATPPAQDASAASNAMLPIAGAAGLGLLGLIGVGVAMRRRKRVAEEAEFEARQSALDEVEPTEAPAQADPLVAEHPSLPLPAEPAPAAALAASAPAQSPTECIEAAPGSHVEAACEGPSADNPSLSIKKRLKRAHFFDQREFLVAAGEAVPVAADAGLSDAVEVPGPAREPA